MRMEASVNGWGAETMASSGIPNCVVDHKLIRRIGGGSYGEVWLAQSVTGALRAIKIVRRSRFKDPRPYEREFSGLSHFEPISRGHEGLVDILQVGRDDQDTYFYCVMELADAHNEAVPQQESSASCARNADHGTNTPGRTSFPSSREPDGTAYTPATLESLMLSKGRIPADECIRIGLVLADALAYVHAHGLVHRDIKPSNVIFVGGVPKLADVGLVAQAADANTFVGTEGFVPPEGPGTARADIYSFGKCLYEIAMGKDRRAFPSPPTLLDGLPDCAALVELNEVITRACQPNPARRYRSARELLADLRLLQKSGSLRQARQRKRILQYGSPALILLLAALWMGGFTGGRRGSVPQTTSTTATNTHELSSTSRLEALRSLAPPPDFRAGHGIFGYLGRSNLPSIFFAHEKKVAITDLNGQTRLLKPWPGPMVEYFEPIGTEEIRKGEGQNLIVWTRDWTNLAVRVFNQGGYEEYSLPEQGGLKAGANEGAPKLPASVIGKVRFLGPNATHPPRMLVEVRHDACELPGYLALRDLTNANSAAIWKYYLGSTISKLDLVDLDGDGVLDILLGTSSGGRNSPSAQSMDGSHSEVVALRQDMSKIMRHVTGGPYSKAQPWVVEDNGHIKVLVRCSVPTATMYLSNTVGVACTGGLYCYGSDGTLLARWQGTNDIASVLVGKLPGRNAPLVLTTDEAGTLREHSFDDLRPIWSTNLVKRTHDWVKLDLIGADDLDGDGRPEIVLQSMQVQFVSGRNPGTPGGDVNLRTGWDTSVIVLDDRLSPIATHVLCRELPSDSPRLVEIIREGPQTSPLILWAHTEPMTLLRLKSKR